MLARQSLRFARAFPAARALVAAQPARSMADTFKEKENAAERDFINRQERELLTKLLQQMTQNPGKAGAAAAAPAAAPVPEDDLSILLRRHGVAATEALKSDLEDWKVGKFKAKK